MGVEGCAKFVKYMLFIFNFIFWLAGVGLIAAGIILLVDPESVFNLDIQGDFEEKVLSRVRYAIIGMIVVGGIIMVVGFFGCCGAIRESRCLLMLFFFSILLIFTVLAALAIILFVLPDKAEEAMKKAMKEDVERYNAKKGASEQRLFMGVLEKTFQCCGVDSSSDYLVKKSTMALNKTIPSSCPKAEIGVVLVPTTLKGCYDKVRQVLTDKAKIAAIVSLLLAIVLILGMIFSMYLCCEIGRSVGYDA